MSSFMIYTVCIELSFLCDMANETWMDLDTCREQVVMIHEEHVPNTAR
jgi:hypothetical protein